MAPGCTPDFKGAEPVGIIPNPIPHNARPFLERREARRYKGYDQGTWVGQMRVVVAVATCVQPASRCLTKARGALFPVSWSFTSPPLVHLEI